MTLLRFLASDDVSTVLLLVGIPTCAFLTAYSGTIWHNAVWHTGRVATPVYLLVALGGVATSLFGGVVASELSFIATVNASPDDFYSTPILAYAGAAVLWPLGWCLLAGALLIIGRGRLGRPARSLLAALVVGFLASALISIELIVVGIVAPRPLRVLSFLAFLVTAVVVSVAASLQSRPRRLDQKMG